MKTEAPEIGMLQRRKEVAFAQGANADGFCSILPWKYQLVGDRTAATLLTTEKTLIAHGEKDLA